MSRILTKEEMNEKLYEYYSEYYGESETEEWLEQLALNVWVFKRAGKYITLKSHILKGTVAEYIE